MSRHARFQLLLVLYLSVITCASAASATATTTTVRATTWFDVNRPYLYVYGVSPAVCAASLNFTDVPDADVTNIGRLSLTSIFEDGFQCAGPSPLVVLTAAALTIPGLLDRVGLSEMYATVTTTNANAAAIAKHPSAQHMLVAWHGAPRSCGTSVHPSSNVYFFMRQDENDVGVASGYTIDFDRGGNGATEEEEGSNVSSDRLFIPNGVPALLVVPNSADICVYVGTGDDLVVDGDATKTITLATGDAPPVPLAPSDPRTPTVSSTPPPSDISPNTESGTDSGVPAIDASTVTNPDSGTGTDASSSGMDVEIERTPMPTYEAVDMTEDGADPLLPGETPTPSYSPSPSMNTATPVTGAGTDADADADTNDEDDRVPIITSSTVEDAGGDGGRACFPSGARVLLVGRHPHHHQRHRHDHSTSTSRSVSTSMSELVVRQPVHGGGPILFFTHRDARARASFVRLSWRSGESILVSHGHYLYVYAHVSSSVTSKSNFRLMKAADIKVGDALVDGVTGLPRTVRSIDQACALGLYNPQTETGVVVVDGVRASTYTSAVHPRIAHWVVTRPVKWALRAVDAVAAASGRRRRGRRRTGAAEWLSWVMQRGVPRLADVVAMVANIATGSVSG